MQKREKGIWHLAVIVLWCVTPLNAQEVPRDLSSRAAEILQQRCYRCHGGASTSAGLDVRNAESLFGIRGNEILSTQFILPGDPDDSLLWQAIDSEYMPLDDSEEADAMTDDERQLIRKWIEDGASFPKRTNAPFVNQAAVFQGVREFLDRQPMEDRKHFRFFSLAHLHNNPSVPEQALRYQRAALAKVLNSLLFKKRRFIEMQPVGIPSIPDFADSSTDALVYAIDLRDLDWERNRHWPMILDHYPYAVQYEYSERQPLRDAFREVRMRCETDQPVIRADWFVVYGSQHPLYTRLLELPENLDGLEQRLGVSFMDNIRSGQVARAGFAKSGVSQQNRLIERHEGMNGYVWVSYDFLPRRGRSDLVRFPLGPRFEENPYNHLAFEHDGGELIFRLPNGMQGYMLVLGDGQRLDDPAPAEIVYDSSGVTGSVAIMNGISCMNCHARGMIAGFQDDVRQAKAVGGDAQRFVEKIYPTADEMMELIEADRQSYLAAESRVVSPYLQDQDIGEPVGKVAQRYYANVDLETAARELGLSDGAALQTFIAANRDLMGMGLGRFVQENTSTIQRATWEATRGMSYFQEIMVHVHPGALPIAPKGLQRRP